ncbi:MAG TPA: SPOR domain-containing protein [Azospira sp.]|nr:SPOR domain-containing protein [Azospira sp.]
MGEDDLKRKLVRRVAFAGVLIAMLLGALAFIDYLGRPADEALDTGPTYSAPVPVPKKEVTQPVKPAEPAPAGADAPPPTEAAAAAAPPALAEVPARPEVDAQPALPVQEGRPVARPGTPAIRTPRGNEAPTPAEGTSSAALPSPPPTAPTPAAAPPATPPATPQPPSRPTSASSPVPETPAPSRLFSGYAVQAGVFSDAQHAEELRARLMLNGIPSTLEARVQVGPFKTRAEAEAAREKLKAIGVDGLLLPPKGAKR